MSSFKRKGSAKQAVGYPGTRTSPASLSTIITSTGIPSLDDILGGGLPLSCTMMTVAPDLHSSYGDLVQKYFIAQGLVLNHNLCIIDEQAAEFVKDIMWTPKSRVVASNDLADGGGDDDTSNHSEQKIKIAWRYEQMKQFQTTVPSSYKSTEEYCHSFDLTSRVPESIIDGALQSGQMSFISTYPSGSERVMISYVLGQIAHTLKTNEMGSPPLTPLRICIPSLGSPQWGELTSQDILYFLHSLRSLLRRHSHACASVGLPPQLSTESWGGKGWIKKLGWLTDAAFTLSAFSANPSLSATFPSHHGFLQIHTLPSPHTLVPPSDKFSKLRGLSASAASPVGSGENNLTFKCTRKRLIFETLHLDIEGGVGERRTTASTNTMPATSGTTPDPTVGRLEDQEEKAALATMEVALEVENLNHGIDESFKATEVLDVKPKKSKKKVAFRSDRPELYDF